MRRTLLRSEGSHSFFPFSARDETRFVRGGGVDMNLRESFTRGQEWTILVENEFPGNLNINFKIYLNYGDIYSSKKKLGKISGKG